MRGPQPEDPADRERVRRLLLAAPWKSATSPRYRHLPHQYSLRRLWVTDADFLWCVEHIRTFGYDEHFIGKWWRYYDLPDADGRTVHQYWAMGNPPPASLINRAVRRAPTPEPQLRFAFD
jgi:hypothetical protein